MTHSVVPGDSNGDQSPSVTKCWCDTSSCGPAVYLWVTKAGYDIPLCVVCTAEWRRFEAEDTARGGSLLQPVRITLLDPA